MEQENEFKAVNEKEEIISNLSEYTGYAKVGYSDASQYKGSFIKGKRAGVGEYTYKNGHVY